MVRYVCQPAARTGTNEGGLVAVVGVITDVPQMAVAGHHPSCLSRSSKRVLVLPGIIKVGILLWIGGRLQRCARWSTLCVGSLVPTQTREMHSLYHVYNTSLLAKSHMYNWCVSWKIIAVYNEDRPS